jgi:hypothetical protein
MVERRCQEYGSCPKKQEPAVRRSRVHPTELACLQELLKRLQDRHVDCAEAVCKKAAADAVSAATVNPDAPILVAQHLRATFCTNKWLLEHVDSRINEMVVMYQSADQVIRPPAPPDVSVCKGIMPCFSFLFLGVPRHYAKRPFSCWCHACSRV